MSFPFEGGAFTLVVSMAVAAEAIVAILAVAEAASMVTLVAPPPPATAEEERETGLPALLGEGPHDTPSWLELEVSRGHAARLELERLPVAYEIEVMEIPSDGEAGDEVEPLVLLQELVVIRSSASPSSRMGATDLVWPCPEDPRKV